MSFLKFLRLPAIVLHAVLLMAIGFSAVSPAQADQFLVFNTGAYHFKNQDERNSLTPGLGWEYSPSSKVGFHIGTLSDSFGYQATYAGLNWASRKLYLGPSHLRVILGATVVNKQFHVDSDPETKILPLPAIELGLGKRAVLNISGSPELDFAGQKNNAVVFFQVKWDTN